LVSAWRHWWRRAEVHRFRPHPDQPAFVWPASWRIDQKDAGDAFFIGGGVGYQWNSWLRFDATAEYRAKASFNALGS